MLCVCMHLGGAAPSFAGTFMLRLLFADMPNPPQPMQSLQASTFQSGATRTAPAHPSLQSGAQPGLALLIFARSTLQHCATSTSPVQCLCCSKGGVRAVQRRAALISMDRCQ